jgi:hypothetical protein
MKSKFRMLLEGSKEDIKAIINSGGNGVTS